jgi:hypothetical protein
MWKLSWTTYRSKNFPFPLPIVRLRQTKVGSLVLVENGRMKCKTEEESDFYELLIQENLYPTLNYHVGSIPVHFALVPFKLALIERHSHMNEKRLMKRLKKRKWDVLFFSRERLATEHGRRLLVNDIYHLLSQKPSFSLFETKKGLSH